jgi:hypothetical protein
MTRNFAGLFSPGQTLNNCTNILQSTTYRMICNLQGMTSLATLALGMCYQTAVFTEVHGLSALTSLEFTGNNFGNEADSTAGGHWWPPVLSRCIL